MALKKPLVLTNGQIEQLQSADTLATAEAIQLLNGNAGAIVIGTPVYSSANGTVDKAQANAVGTVNVIGMVSDSSIAAAGTGGIQLDGVVVATTGQWDVIAGTTGGLTKDVLYYLDATVAGKITSTAPLTAGQFVKTLGSAISTTELKLNIQGRIKL